ncbi:MULTISPECIES: NADPH:quinone oxidoreductase family protein [unclassified Bradyrhizobium]|uniref:NADPH:quinone oxidoreductase family protein n=1 Tax=unclassified Bradyrhizobium TaxID=2631580 RepID=UPI00247A5DFD|nr:MULTISPECIES: NADPH:quinone oxidoreductase family protein [unclassified Bradyrhizobium]WGR73013.1 NADPH:quinone oxidoreductase family protein [Bradyrhizobium sp. ISRA426]WGR77848.1 NADPH:quinone oxidoreductase family protein [Bradyrhizobium sp. ISRA430]WGR88253.1 NADPH:quinone oxidoreductase family protein [Bradyrhizobium sp. ISRA432]
MKAMISRSTGGPETLVLEEVDDPEAAVGQIVVRIKASGVNFPDALIIEDRYQFKPKRPFSPGGEFSGIVEAIGGGVSSLEPGDRVMGFSRWGAMAQKIAINASRCAVIPDKMPFDEASVFFLTYGTSYYALKERGDLRDGETLLVLGAAGGVGLATIEIGKAMGARVVAAVSTPAKARKAREHGADRVVIYPPAPFDASSQRDLARLFKAACDPDGAHVVCDVVGGNYSEAALRAIAWDGRFLVVGFTGGIPQIPLNLPLLKSCKIVGVFFGPWLDRGVDRFSHTADELLEWYEAGKLRPFISARFPLEEAGNAIAQLATRKAVGKIVVNID